jgi:hypothetical protein
MKDRFGSIVLKNPEISLGPKSGFGVGFAGLGNKRPRSEATKLPSAKPMLQAGPQPKFLGAPQRPLQL